MFIPNIVVFISLISKKVTELAKFPKRTKWTEQLFLQEAIYGILGFFILEKTSGEVWQI